MSVAADRVGGRDVAAQHVVEARALVARDAEPDGRVALRVDVDDQRLVAGRRDAGGDVDGGGGLPDPALLVRDRVDGGHRGFDASGGCGGFGPERTRFRGFGTSRVHVFADRGRFVAIPGRRGKRSGVGAVLAEHVQRVVARAGVRLRRRTSIGSQAELARRPRRRPRPPRSSTAPFHATSDTAEREQRRGVLADHRQRGQRAGRDEVVRADALWPRLRPRVDRRRRWPGPLASTARSR